MEGPNFVSDPGFGTPQFEISSSAGYASASRQGCTGRSGNNMLYMDGNGNRGILTGLKSFEADFLAGKHGIG